ncbi:sce7726 family protein [Mesorhizobium sp. 1M-11]|uniref:sce7726 family protein n=1 Tax=Mesorhizobium sp. 1M-11 TaxID=1529006 RepID=UPI000A958A50|nr:sce7726 family protein [Mesorhizobium sp. 1M-11]
MDKCALSNLATRDSCIRGPLVAWLKAQHPDDGSTGVIQELKMPRPSARIDLAVVNGELAGFEIKSDADTLKRLRVQVPAFSRFFDRVSVVTTRKHLCKTERCVPDWWGIILYQADDEFRVHRRARQNRCKDIRALLYALSKSEIAELASRASSAIPKGKKDAMVEVVAYTVSHRVICDHARDIIRLRAQA